VSCPFSTSLALFGNQHVPSRECFLLTLRSKTAAHNKRELAILAALTTCGDIDPAALLIQQVQGNSCKGVRVVQGWDGSSIYIRSGWKSLRFISWFTGKVRTMRVASHISGWPCGFPAYELKLSHSLLLRQTCRLCYLLGCIKRMCIMLSRRTAEAHCCSPQAPAGVTQRAVYAFPDADMPLQTPASARPARYKEGYEALASEA